MQRQVLSLALLALAATTAAAEPPLVAVAASFRGTAETLFGQGSVGPVRLVSASTGKLATEILHGAPYELFIAAESRRPLALQARGRLIACREIGRGQLVVWSARPLRRFEDLAGLARVALASPATAPYGRAAREALQRSALWQDLEPRLVFGQNAAQALQFALSGGARAALVASAQARALPRGHVLLVDAEKHAPITHLACLAPDAGRDAVELHRWLLSPDARERLRVEGYLTVDGS